MFSPIFCTSALRLASTVSLLIVSCESAAISAGFWSATSSASPFAKLWKSSFFATKSVSLFTSTSTPILPLALNGGGDHALGRHARGLLRRCGQTLLFSGYRRLFQNRRLLLQAPFSLPSCRRRSFLSSPSLHLRILLPWFLKPPSCNSYRTRIIEGRGQDLLPRP